eukprot:145693_1
MSELGRIREMSANEPMTVVGGGLSGAMMALLLSRRDDTCSVRLLEKREDLRITSSEDDQEYSFEGVIADSSKRSINLALSYRGIQALKAVDLWETIQERNLIIEMRGRMMHRPDGSCYVQPYGHETSDKEHRLWSISRTDLNALLLDELEKRDNVEISFNHKVTRVHDDGSLTVETLAAGEVDRTTLKSKFIIGADGIHSSVRSSMMRLGRFNFCRKFIPHCYKELTMWPDTKGNPKMDPNYLHIWPCDDFMLIALPNPDKTFTCTLFAPYEGKNGFKDLDSHSILHETSQSNRIRKYFQQNFPSAISLIPDFLRQFLSNPTSPLMQINLAPWHLEDKVCVLGDAAHAIVPFYGQGMNSGFEDCLIMSELIDKHKSDIGKIFSEFSRTRRPAADTLAELSNRNYVEMRSLTAKRWFIWKKIFEQFLNRHFPLLWIPLYSMVTFSRIPYDEAEKKSKGQDRWLLRIASVVSVAVLAVCVAKFVRGP